MGPIFFAIQKTTVRPFGTQNPLIGTRQVVSSPSFLTPPQTLTATQGWGVGEKCFIFIVGFTWTVHS